MWENCYVIPLKNLDPYVIPWIHLSLRRVRYLDHFSHFCRAHGVWVCIYVSHAGNLQTSSLVWFGFSLECDSITHLLQAQINIQSCQYLPALLELFAAHTKLNTWQSLLTARDVGVRSLCC